MVKFCKLKARGRGGGAFGWPASGPGKEKQSERRRWLGPAWGKTKNSESPMIHARGVKAHLQSIVVTARWELRNKPMQNVAGDLCRSGREGQTDEAVDWVHSRLVVDWWTERHDTQT
jgi:hypothetical protein